MMSTEDFFIGIFRLSVFEGKKWSEIGPFSCLFINHKKLSYL